MGSYCAESTIGWRFLKIANKLNAKHVAIIRSVVLVVTFWEVTFRGLNNSVGHANKRFDSGIVHYGLQSRVFLRTCFEGFLRIVVVVCCFCFLSVLKGLKWFMVVGSAFLIAWVFCVVLFLISILQVNSLLVSFISPCFRHSLIHGSILGWTFFPLTGLFVLFSVASPFRSTIGSKNALFMSVLWLFLSYRYFCTPDGVLGSVMAVISIHVFVPAMDATIRSIGLLVFSR